MKHVATVPKLGVHPELRTFKCKFCQHVNTIEFTRL